MSMMALGQNESTTKPTETAATPTTAIATPISSITATSTPGNTSVTPPSLGGLGIIFGAMVLIVLIPIAIFAWYNKTTLEKVLKANSELSELLKNEKLNQKLIEKDIKPESVTTLIKALIPPEPLGMPNGSVRAVIAIIGISIFAYAVFTFSESRTELVAALIALVSSVTGFYFGARATEKVRASGSTSDTNPSE